MNATETTLSPHFFQDLAEGILQQMFFWGQDVSRPEGNFLVAQGFERSSTHASKGTSRYRLPWQNGHIELYGACAGWYGAEGGFTFIRPRRRCAIWLSNKETPTPGAWQQKYIGQRTKKSDLYLASLPFLDWLISHEQEVVSHFGSSYRQSNHWKYDKLPKAKAWIEPEAALQWFQCFRDTPDQLTRPKHFAKNQSKA